MTPISKLVPRRIRDLGRPLVRRVERTARNVRWRCSNPATIETWLEQRLQLSTVKWIFLLGVNNSGTTIVSRVMAAHPKISSLPGEGQWFTTAFPNPWDYGVARLWSEREDIFHWTESNDSTPARRAMFDWAYELQPASMILEKSPTHTLRSRWLQANSQRAHFIMLTRSPYGVAEGIRRRLGVSIDRAARHWKRTHEIFLEDAPYLERLLWLKYEDFCQSPNDALTKLEEYLELELPYDRNILDKEFAVHNVNDSAAKIQDFNRKSIERLMEDEIKTITEICQPLMQQLGYEPVALSSTERQA